MTADILTRRSRELFAELVAGIPFLFGISRGLPAWDAAWGGVNPPVPDPEATALKDLIGYARPTAISYLVPDAAGAIISDTGTRYAISATPTKFLRVRMSVAAGSFTNQTVREIGLFARRTVKSGVPAGKTILATSEVESDGILFRVRWDRPQFMNPSTTLATDFIVRL